MPIWLGSDITYIGFSQFLVRIFPLYIKFKGGKAVATSVGYLFTSNLLLIFVEIFLIILFTEYHDISSILAVLFAAISSFLKYQFYY